VAEIKWDTSFAGLCDDMNLLDDNINTIKENIGIFVGKS
jgi:uncharacterized protein YdcH (DUF465 family)